jgi:hypothetical protein
MVESKAQRLAAREEFETTKEGVAKIEAYVETHPGKLSIMELEKKLKVGYALCKRVIESHPLVGVVDERLKNKPGPQKRYISFAVPPPPTPEGIIEETMMTKGRLFDKLGMDARADFFELIRVRSLALHQRKRRRRR